MPLVARLPTVAAQLPTDQKKWVCVWVRYTLMEIISNAWLVPGNPETGRGQPQQEVFLINSKTVERQIVYFNSLLARPSARPRAQQLGEGRSLSGKTTEKEMACPGLWFGDDALSAAKKLDNVLACLTVGLCILECSREVGSVVLGLGVVFSCFQRRVCIGKRHTWGNRVKVLVL